jgi:hypothetical protein
MRKEGTQTKRNMCNRNTCSFKSCSTKERHVKVYDLKSLNKRLDVGSALELVTPLHKVLVVG